MRDAHVEFERAALRQVEDVEIRAVALVRAAKLTPLCLSNAVPVIVKGIRVTAGHRTSFTKFLAKVSVPSGVAAEVVVARE